MESSGQKSEMSSKAVDGHGHISPGLETKGRLSAVSSSSTSSFNSIENTDDIGMEDEEDDAEHKPKLPPLSPQSSSKNMMTTETTNRFDSNRIPSAVFSRKPTNRMEWSVASNDSLFSIQMNNSFSMGPDVMLAFDDGNASTTKDEGVEFGVNDKSRMNDICTIKEEDSSMIRQQQSPLIPRKDDKNHSFDITHHAQEPVSPLSGTAIPLSTGGNYYGGGGDMPNHNRESSVAGTHISRESGHSNSSFAFPLLATDKMSNAATPDHQHVKPMINHGGAEEKPKSGPQTVPEAAGTVTETAAANPGNSGEKKWLSCFSCFNCKLSKQAKGNDKVET